MTNFTTRIMIAAATLVVAAGSASAQVLKAEIPFTFRAGGVVMQAGTYQVYANQGNGRMTYRVSSANGKQAILLVAGAPRDPQKDWAAGGNPVLSFQCGTSRCALAEIWTASGPSYTVPHPAAGKDEPMRTALVIMHSDKAE